MKLLRETDMERLGLMFGHFLRIRGVQEDCFGNAVITKPEGMSRCKVSIFPMIVLPGLFFVLGPRRDVSRIWSYKITHVSLLVYWSTLSQKTFMRSF